MKKIKIVLFGREIEIIKDIDGCFIIPDFLKDIEPFGTALKPANEPICVARKPLEKGLTVAENVLKYGTGALNIDVCRISTRQEDKDIINKKANSPKDYDQPIYGKFEKGYSKPANDQGRWPANIIFSDYNYYQLKNEITTSDLILLGKWLNENT